MKNFICKYVWQIKNKFLAASQINNESSDQEKDQQEFQTYLQIIKFYTLSMDNNKEDKPAEKGDKLNAK